MEKATEASTPSMETRFNQLVDMYQHITSLMYNMMVGQATQASCCGICGMIGHPTYMCHTHSFDGFQQRNHDSFSYGYNPTLSQDYQNFNYGAQQPNFQHFHHGPAVPSSSSNDSSLADVINSLALNTQQYQNVAIQFQKENLHFQAETRANIQNLDSKINSSLKNLEHQFSQLATSVVKLESQCKLPSQNEVNANHIACSVTLKNGKELEDPPSWSRYAHSTAEPEIVQNSDSVPAAKKSSQTPSFIVRPPFPQRFQKSNKERDDKEILETFRKVAVNIPLLDAIKNMPSYEKFLKELCTNRKKLAENEKVQMAQNVSAIIQKKLPPKCRDQGMFSIPCRIGNVYIEQAMCDLGASINVMPLSLYSTLNAGELKKTNLILRLADKSYVYPKGVLEDVLVQVDGLVFPADFYVLDMKDDHSEKRHDILLGRPFLSTAKTKINVYEGTFSMEFDGEVVKFNVMKSPNEVSSVCKVEIVDFGIQEVLELPQQDESDIVLDASINKDCFEKLKKDDETHETYEEVMFQGIGITARNNSEWVENIIPKPPWLTTSLEKIECVKSANLPPKLSWLSKIMERSNFEDDIMISKPPWCNVTLAPFKNAENDVFEPP